MKRGKKILKKVLIPEEKLRDAMELHSGKTRAEVQNLIWKELRKKLLLGSVFAVVFLLLSWSLGRRESEQAGIKRPLPGNDAVETQVELLIEEEWETVPVLVGALEYEEEEVEVLHKAAEGYLRTVIAGENESLSRIKKALYFPNSLPEQVGSVSWSTDAPWLVTSKGEVRNEELTEEQKVEITATISYGSEVRCFRVTVTVYPKEYTPEEQRLQQVSEELGRQEETTRTKEWFVLPEQVQGYPVKQAEQDNLGAGAFFVLLAVVVPLLLYSGYFGSLDKKRRERKVQAEESYTGFVTRLSLLLAAGVPVRQAFLRMEKDYEKQYGMKHVLTTELQITKQELENGYSEATVYEAFGRRIGVLAYRRMASLLEQNTSKGVQGIRSLLLQEAKEVMAQERAKIKIKGEQAGTKLLLPMMGLLFLVFAILLVPAFQSF